jgi:cyclophilin family peptidyl-prolyl cis-trans isomerase
VHDDPLLVVAKAEDQRAGKAISRDLERSHDPKVRRAVARARARILDEDDSPLLRALEDDDDEVVAWAGHGLGESCKGREEAHVRALAARLASFRRAHSSQAAMLRALGRCAAADASEPTLRAWLRQGGEAGEAAAYALGDLAALRGSLSQETAAALLDATQGTLALVGGTERLAPVEAALYPFGRAEAPPSTELAPKLAAAARAALGRPGSMRIFAVRALARSGVADAAPELRQMLESRDASPAERVEAARGLARLKGPGQAALADALDTLAPDRAEALLGDGLGPLLATIEGISANAPKKAFVALRAIARLSSASGATPAIVRRTSAVRCAAAAKLALGAWDSDVLRSCDLGDGQAGERARLGSLDREPLVKARRAAWAQLARSEHRRVREAALDLIARHPELGEAAVSALAEALSSEQAGVVATAAGIVQGHPDRVFVLSRAERMAALDPGAPPPSATPTRELDPSVAAALRSAIARAWTPDLVETRVAIVDASLAVGLPEALPFAHRACSDANVTVRARAAKALSAAGEKDAVCPPPDVPGEVAAEVGHSLTRAVRVAFDTDTTTVAVRFDPGVAPVAVTRFVALAKAGFYTGIEVHRAVPGFVVQLGDRGADGYGGSGELLRCETAPVPFGPLDVGVALAGRDTGSSQFFVTLARYPHLDGEYPWVGHAEGDWDAIAEGDMVRAVRVEE